MKNKKIYFVGGGIVALALLIVLLAVFVPILTRRSEMGELLEKAQSPERVTLGDPLFETGDILGNKGKEILLSGEARDEALAYLSKLEETGYRTDGTEKMPAGSLELNLKIKATNGEILNLWFNENNFYYMKGTAAVLFEAKDGDGYEAFYRELQRLLKENE